MTSKLAKLALLASTRMRTQPGRMSGGAMSSNAAHSGPPYFLQTTAFTGALLYGLCPGRGWKSH